MFDLRRRLRVRSLRSLLVLNVGVLENEYGGEIACADEDYQPCLACALDPTRLQLFLAGIRVTQ